MKGVYSRCAAITLVLGTACGSNEVGAGSHVDASQGGTGAAAGGTRTGSGNTGGQTVGAGGNGSIPTAGGSTGVVPASGGSSSANAGGGATSGITGTPLTTGGSVGVTTGGSVGVTTGGSVGVTTGGSVGVTTGGSVSTTTGGTVGVTTGGAVGDATGGTIQLATGGIGGSLSTVCTPGELASCSTGLLGVCASGQKKCNATGTDWKDCVQLQPKSLADCSSTEDKDCDGKPDNQEFGDYRIDADQDKYCTTGTLTHVCKGSQPSNAILVSACLGTDCDDASYFRNTSCTPCVTGLAVTEDNATAPTGFEKINVDLNDDVGGNQIWLWKRMVADAPCLTDIELSYTSNPASNPFDSTWTVSSVNLNDGVAADKIIHIGWKADPHGTSILNVSVNSGYNKLSDPVYSTSSTSTWYIAQWTAGSVDNWGNDLSGNADANKNVSGPYVYVLYQK